MCWFFLIPVHFTHFCHLPAVQVCIFQPRPEVSEAEGTLVSAQHVADAGNEVSEFRSRTLLGLGSNSGPCHCTGKHLWPVPHEALSVMLCSMDIQRLQLTTKSWQFPRCLALEPGLSISTKDWAILRCRNIFEWGMEAIKIWFPINRTKWLIDTIKARLIYIFIFSVSWVNRMRLTITLDLQYSHHWPMYGLLLVSEWAQSSFNYSELGMHSYSKFHSKEHWASQWTLLIWNLREGSADRTANIYWASSPCQALCWTLCKHYLFNSPKGVPGKQSKPMAPRPSCPQFFPTTVNWPVRNRVPVSDKNMARPYPQVVGWFDVGWLSIFTAEL